MVGSGRNLVCTLGDEIEKLGYIESTRFSSHYVKTKHHRPSQVWCSVSLRTLTSIQQCSVHGGESFIILFSIEFYVHDYNTGNNCLLLCENCVK